MFRFANIEYLWLLLSIPAFIAGYILLNRHKRRQLAEFGDPELVNGLMPNASHIRPIVKFSLMMVTLALLILAAARPQFGQKEKTVKRQGIEVMIALDISNSMMAEDVAPCRLDRAKQMLSRMIDKMVDDKVGLVVFAGEAYTQLPITCDYVSAKMFLNTITPDLIKTQGTAIGDALHTSIRSFGSDDSQASRAIVLITDGENHEDDAVAAATQAKEKGIHIYVIGIGKPEGSPIPIPGTGNFRKDREGNVVVSRLNEDMCRQIAQAGNGLYVRCDNTNTAMKALQKELDTLATQEIETKIYADYNEQYQSFALVALLLLVIEFFIFSRKNKTLSKMNLFAENKALKTLFVLTVLSASPCTDLFAQQEAPDIRHGNRRYKKENFTEAETDYRRGLDKNNQSAVAHFNLGDALFRQNKYPEAAEQFAEAAKLQDPKKDGKKLAQTYHNLGNALYGQQQYDKAVAAYQNALRLNPKDDDTRYNLIKAMQMLQQQQQQQQDQNQNQQQQQEQQQNQNQQQQQQEQQQNQDQMDKETAEQILQALEQDEQDTQEKLQRQQGSKRRVEKDW